MVIRANIETFRQDKPNPRYYAERTVSRAQAVMNAVTAVTLWEGHVNAYSDVRGTTIYHISKASQKDSNYTYYRSTIDLALTTSWDEFLNAYAQ